MDALLKPDEEVDWSDDSPQAAEKIALALHSKYCGNVAPTQESVAVEAKCDALTISDPGITLTGTIDRVYRDEDGSPGIADIKPARPPSADMTVKT